MLWGGVWDNLRSAQPFSANGGGQYSSTLSSRAFSHPAAAMAATEETPVFHFSDCDIWLDIDCSGDGRGPRVNGEFAAPYMGSGEFLPGGGLLVWRAIGTALEVVELRPPLQLHESAFRIHLPGARTFRPFHCGCALGKRGRLGVPRWRRMGGG